MSPEYAPRHAWRLDNALWLALRLERLRLLLARRSMWLHRGQDTGVRPADWIVSPGTAEEETRFFATDPGVTAIDESIRETARITDELETRMRRESFPPALVSLSDMVGLSDVDEEILLFAAAPGLDAAFRRACGELHDDPRRDHPTLHLALGIFFENPEDRLLAADHLAPGQPLRSLRLIEIDDQDGDPLLTARLSVDDRMTAFLRGIGQIDSRLETILLDVHPTVPIGPIARTAAHVASVIRKEHDRWTTINLVGRADHGARDVANRACEELGIRLRTIDIERLSFVPPGDQHVLIELMGREALLGGFALLLETDTIDDAGAESRMVNDILSRVPAALFLISAERWASRTDMYLVEVERLSPSEQVAMWQATLAPYAHSVNGEVGAIVQQFNFGSSAITEIIERARCQSDGAITGQALWQACREQQGNSLHHLARRIEPNYRWGDLIASDDLRHQLEELANQVQHRSTVYETWGFGAQLGRGRGITALFAGPSGTGKTMAAEILAARIDLNLYRIDLSGVVSKYVGETEKNLKRVFDAAEESGAILLFDEADSLFGTRTEGRDSHDRYMNLEINYLLQRMEDYTGLAILATNRRGALDQAFLRRLRFVIDFPFPGIEDRRRIWEHVFPPQAELDNIEFGVLANLEITGGNIRSIAVNAAFLAASENVPIGMPHIARAASREYSKLSKPVSAAEFGPFYEMVRP